ncbi:MAG: apolipoprotein N-acyltransferase [Bacteroidales bacterium]|nr:apolipoprotein N-acyltransferase [Bacteroidales bacterium]
MLRVLSRPLFLSILSGVLLALSWYESVPSVTVFFGFVPLFYVVNQLISGQRAFWRVMFYSFIAFFTWNLGSTWWICQATAAGGVAAFVITALLMTLVMAGYYFIRKHAGASVGMFGFVALWISYEYFFHNSEIAWPWLTLGNGIGNHVWLIQWYEYTGVLCGSLWILSVNFFISGLFISWQQKIYGRILWYVVDLLILLVLPVAISLYRYSHYQEEGTPANIAVIQPNIDPYNEKFNGLSNKQQVSIMLDLAQHAVDSTTDYVVCPESAIDDRIWIHNLPKNPSITRIRTFVQQHPRVKWITGVISMREFAPGDSVPPTARKFRGRKGGYYNAYNSAIQVDTTDSLPLYHKSKLVVGVEMMPYPQYVKFLEKFSIDLGGFVGSFGTQPDRGVFPSSDGRFGIGPIICYESVFGEYVSDYVKNGANLLFVITNDGWWGNTPGYMQHLTYSRIRAIEMRRSIARSANTGISALINQRGDVVYSLGWWERGAVSGTVCASNKLTYYARKGDYIGSIAVAFMLVIFGVACYNWLVPGKHRRIRLEYLRKRILRG